MTDIEFMKQLREICNKRCNSKDEDYYPPLDFPCPFPWSFCDLDKGFERMTDEELEEICRKVRESVCQTASII